MFVVLFINASLKANEPPYADGDLCTLERGSGVGFCINGTRQNQSVPDHSGCSASTHASFRIPFSFSTRNGTTISERTADKKPVYPSQPLTLPYRTARLGRNEVIARTASLPSRPSISLLVVSGPVHWTLTRAFAHRRPGSSQNPWPSWQGPVGLIFFGSRRSHYPPSV